MMRVQVQLRPSQQRALKRRARTLGVSVAEVVRRCVDAQLAESGDARDAREVRVQRALAAAGRYADPDGQTDVAANHDRHLAEAYRR